MSPTARRIGLALAAVVGGVVALVLLPVDAWLLALAGWVRAAGLPGVLIFGVVYALAVVAFIPASALTLAAGFLWGPVGGLLIVSPASVAGATLSFLLGRTLLRERVAARMAGHPRFTALDVAIGRRGFLLVGLLRLSPLFPFVLLNYALGLTRVRTGTYVLASFLGMLPGTFLYTYLGSTLTQLAQITSGDLPDDPATRWLYWGGLVATLAVTVLVTRIATQALKRHVDSGDDTP